jgi:hypothetical protein
VRLPALRRTSPANPEDFRAHQERRLVQAAVSDYCGEVRFRNFKRLMGAVSLLVITVVGCVAVIDGHGAIDLIVHLFG